MNDVIKIYICGKIHHYSTCDCDIKNFQKFLCWFSIHEMSHFCEFLGSYSPKYCLVLVKLWLEAIYNKKNTVSQKYFKILNFGSNGMQLKFTVLVHFEAKLTAGKPKILLKTQVFAKTASLGIINNVSPKS